MQLRRSRYRKCCKNGGVRKRALAKRKEAISDRPKTKNAKIRKQSQGTLLEQNDVEWFSIHRELQKHVSDCEPDAGVRKAKRPDLDHELDVVGRRLQVLGSKSLPRCLSAWCPKDPKGVKQRSSPSKHHQHYLFEHAWFLKALGGLDASLEGKFRNFYKFTLQPWHPDPASHP